MGGLSYFTTRHFLLAGRETAAQHQAFANAARRAQLPPVRRHPVRHAPRLHRRRHRCPLRAVPPVQGLRLLAVGQRRRPSPTSCARSCWPARPPPRPTARPQGTAEIVVGVPVPSVHADYFEVFDLSDLDHTLRVLGLTLFGAGVVTTLLGVALGRFASERSLRPLADVSRAAGAIAGGELDTRLDADGGRPRPRGPDQLVQRHGRPAPGAHRARGAVQLRRQPRAAVPAHDPGRLARGRSRPTATSCRRARSGRCSS